MCPQLGTPGLVPNSSLSLGLRFNFGRQNRLVADSTKALTSSEFGAMFARSPRAACLVRSRLASDTTLCRTAWHGSESDPDYLSTS